MEKKIKKQIEEIIYADNIYLNEQVLTSKIEKENGVLKTTYFVTLPNEENEYDYYKVIENVKYNGYYNDLYVDEINKLEITKIDSNLIIDEQIKIIDNTLKQIITNTPTNIIQIFKKLKNI